MALSLRSRALRLRRSVFLGMCSLQRCDDVDDVISLPFVHFDLPCPSIRVGLGNDSLCVVQLRSMHVEEVGIGAEVSAIQTRIRMRTWPSNDRNGAVAVWQGLSQHVAREPAQITGVERPFF